MSTGRSSDLPLVDLSDDLSECRHLALVLTFSTDWFITVSQEIMTETGIWGR